MNIILSCIAIRFLLFIENRNAQKKATKLIPFQGNGKWKPNNNSSYTIKPKDIM